MIKNAKQSQIQRLFFTELIPVWRSAAPDECPRSGDEVGNEERFTPQKASPGNEGKDGNLSARKFGKISRLHSSKERLLKLRNGRNAKFKGQKSVQ